MATAIPRLRREQQVERNRGQLLAAARQVFLERGFHGATLDAIAEAAGFSKGVVYSQFESKADLFLALLEQRIDERAAENEDVARRGAGGSETFAELFDVMERRSSAEPAWHLLVLEFRVHAARDPALNERYARVHARTLERLATTLRTAAERVGVTADESVEARAVFAFALGTGLALEKAASPNGLPYAGLHAIAQRAMATKEAGAVAAPAKADRPAALRSSAGRKRSRS